MKTRHIILGLGLLGAALTAVVGGIGLGGLRWVGQAVQASTTANQATQSATLGDMMHEGLRGDVFQALYLAQAGRAADVTKARTEAKAHAAEFIERVAQLRALPLEPDQAEAAARLAPIVQRYADMGQALCERAATDLPGALQTLPAFEALFEELAQVQDALIDSIAARQEATRDAALARQQQALWAMGAAALLGTVTLVLLALGVARHLMRTLGGEPTQVRHVLHEVADGDLSQRPRVAAGDEHSVMAGIAEMIGHLQATVGEVRGNASGLASAASQVHAGSAHLADRTSQQAAALEASMASLQDMVGLVESAAGHAVQARGLVQQANGIAGRSGTAVEAVVETMQGIEQSSRRIGDIIGVIDGIAFQTNILALNAAVEAARAGEQGRGFAVVASEVRSLAQRSAGAAREVKELINESVRQVEQGSVHVSEAGQAMQSLLASVGEVAALVEQMAGASQAQHQGIDRVVETVRQLEDMTQQNAALVEQSAAAAGSLHEQAGRLNAAVERFRVAG